MVRGTLNPKEHTMGTKKRLEYIDVIRGITITLVVLQHVVSICYTPKELSPAYLSLQQVRMPLFFFISGFLFFKIGRDWNLREFTGFIKKKIPVQILSPAIFMFIYCLFIGIGFKEGIMNKSKYGYWFTFTLFQFFIFFITTQKVLGLLKIKGVYSCVALLLTGWLVCVISLNSIEANSIWNKKLADLLGTDKWHYYIFFVSGTIIKKYFAHFEQLIKKNITVVLCFAIVVVINIKKVYLLHFFDYQILQFVCGITSITFVFALFRKLENVLSKKRIAGKILQLVGSRTLDIYLMHFFFVYSTLGRSILAPEFDSNLFQILYIIFITAAIVATTLAISWIIRLNPTLGHFLFGSKKAQVTEKTAKA